GNETTVKNQVTVKPATTSAVSISVTLDKTTVKPGGFVTATIFIIGTNGVPRAGESVSLSVGVIPIATSTTDLTGIARISFAAPPNEGEAADVVLAAGGTGRATLTVAKCRAARYSADRTSADPVLFSICGGPALRLSGFRSGG